MRKLKNNERLVRILCFVFMAVFSVCVLANLLPNAKFMTRTLERLEENQKTILEFSGATISASVALSALPNDFASPVANLFAEMNKYAAFILAVVLFEKIILVNGVRFALTWGIPVACGFYILSQFVRKDAAKQIGYKLVVLSLAVILAVPVSTYVVEAVGDSYMDYVEQTIAETEKNTAIIEETSEDGDETKTLFEKLETAFRDAATGVGELVTNFKNLAKKCATSVAILILNTFFAPLLVFLFVRWLLKELFSLNLPAPRIKVVVPGGLTKPGAAREEEREEATVR